MSISIEQNVYNVSLNIVSFNKLLFQRKLIDNAKLIFFQYLAYWMYSWALKKWFVWLHDDGRQILNWVTINDILLRVYLVAL